MKILYFFILFSALSFQGNSQALTTIPVRNETEVYLDTIIRNEGTVKGDLFSASKIWLSSFFKSGKAVIDLEDKESGTIICKGVSIISVQTAIGGEYETRCNYTLRIDVKDSKCRLQVYDVYYRGFSYTVNGVVYPEKETYPSDWYLPKIGKHLVKTSGSYRDETIKVLNNIVGSFSAGISDSSKLSLEW